MASDRSMAHFPRVAARAVRSSRGLMERIRKVNRTEKDMGHMSSKHLLDKSGKGKTSSTSSQDK